MSNANLSKSALKQEQQRQERDPSTQGDTMRGTTAGLRAKAFSRATNLGSNMLGRASAFSAQHEQFATVTHGLNRAQGFLNSHQHQPSARSTSSAAYDNSLPTGASSSTSRLRLLTSSGRAARKTSNYTEERCITFPSYAVVRPTLGAPQVEVEVSGFVFRTRPIDQATRTQKVFVKLAQQLAGVKKPSSGKSSKKNSPQPSPRNSMFFDETSPPPSRAGSVMSVASDSSYDPSAQDQVLADIMRLTDQNATEEDVERAFADLKLTEEPQSLYTPDSTPPPTPRMSTTQLAATAHQEDSPTTPRRAPGRVNQQGSIPPPIPPRPSKSSSTSTNSSNHSATSSQSSFASDRSSHEQGPRQRQTSTMSSQQQHPHHEAIASTISNLDLDTDASQMYRNLQDRLRAFFSQKLDQRRIRLSVFLDDPNTPEPEQRCLARGTVVSAPGGGFKQVVSFPAILKDTEQHLLDAWLRITTELLPMDEDATESTAPGRFDCSSAKVLPHDIPRVISDIDDTVKVSEVLGGARRVFRNVFALPFERIIVDGMSDWYNEMTSKGASIHYVSNGPWELTEVVRRFLEAARLPHGQLKLKEYVGGSFLSGMWESAAGRKRQNVVSVLTTFPDSKFILIGDSGEQDLELYTEVARSHPQRIMGIFIRDVSSSGSKSPIRSDLSSVRPPGGQYMADSTTDALSPNNPLQTTDYGERRMSISLYRRLRDAEALLPDGCILRSFKSGQEVAKDAVDLVAAAMAEARSEQQQTSSNSIATPQPPSMQRQDTITPQSSSATKRQAPPKPPKPSRMMSTLR